MKKNRFLPCRILSLFLAAAMAVTFLPESAFLEGTAGDASRVEAATTVTNPRIVSDSSMTAGQKVTWDCVYFGSYPQTEVVSKSDTTRIAALKNMNEYFDTEYETVSAAKFARIKSASYDSNGDATVGSEKYRRIRYSDMTYADTCVNDCDYVWGDETYHYFKYEPIKWRVLDVSDGKALLLADKVIDTQVYNTDSETITWEKSTIRSFLNSYGSTENTVGNSYSSRGFLNNAFSSGEQGAILTKTLENADNLEYGTAGGNSTDDRIFLLSESDVYGTDTAVSYGFAEDNSTYDEARRSESSTYAYAMGAWRTKSTAYAGNCTWWLRSSGYSTNAATLIAQSGWGNRKGIYATDNFTGVRPALYLDLSAADQYDLAGTVCSTAMKNKVRLSTKGSQVKISSIKLSGISKKIAAGKKIKLTAKISPSKASNQSLKWTSSDKSVATVNKNGVVKLKKTAGGRSVTITATAKDGSGKKASYRIRSMKGIVKKVTIKGKKSVKAGKKLKLKATVGATKGANTKLLWKSNNTKYATVNAKGVVTAKKAGKGKKVKITAMATDGSGKKVTVKIKIK